MTIGAALIGAAFAHHGWGSYDAAKPVTVTGPILRRNTKIRTRPSMSKGSDKEWTVTLAPTFRMTNRGATADIIAVGKTVVAFGYPSTVEKDEMRAERITIDGKTYEMR